MKHIHYTILLSFSFCAFGMYNQHIVPTGNMFEKHNVPQEIVNHIVQDALDPIQKNALFHMVPSSQSTCLYTTIAPNIYDYYQHSYDQEELHYARTLNSLEIIKIVSKYDNVSGEKILADTHDSDCGFRLQLWTEIDPYPPGNKIRLDDDMTYEGNTFKVKETPLSKHSIFFDGANKDGICAIGINSDNSYRLLFVDKRNPISDQKTGRRDEQNKRPTVKIESKKECILHYLMMHYHKNRLVHCIRDSTIGKYTLSINDLPDTIAQENLSVHDIALDYLVPISTGHFSHGFKSIGRLTDWTYLALTEQSKLATIERCPDSTLKKSTKNVFFKDKNGVLHQDLFDHLAVDNCTDTYENTGDERHATHFVVINKQGDLLWGSFKTIFYNKEDKITLRKIDNIVYKNCKNIWLRDNKIGILMHHPTKTKLNDQSAQPLCIVTKDIQFSELL